MLLGCIYIYLDRTGVVLVEQVLYRIEVVLTHIAEAPTVVIPVSPERLVDAVRVIRLAGCRTQPHIVVELGRYRFRFEVGPAAPVELPVESRDTADSHLQRPSQHAAFHYFLYLFYRCLHSVETGPEPEPGVESEDPSIPPYRLDNPASFADRPGHGFFTPDIFPGIGGRNSDQTMPVRRSGYVNDVDIGTVENFAEIPIAIHSLTGLLHCFSQMLLIHITHCKQPGAAVINMPLSHSTHTDNRFGQFITGCGISLTSKHGSWNDRDRGRCRDAAAQEFTPADCFQGFPIPFNCNSRYVV